jgi:predicted DNA-binding transcriptional regulator AlpA
MQEQSLMLTTADAAKLCGVTTKRWRTWNSLGKTPPPLCVGKSLFWKRDELLDWIDEGCPHRKYWKVFLERKARKGLPSP